MPPFPDGGQYSILTPTGVAVERRETPSCFRDLNLDQIVDAVIAPWPEHDLASFFHAPVRCANTVVYRQEVMRDLERLEIMQVVERFISGMRQMRVYFGRSEAASHNYEKKRWFLNAASRYCEAVEALHADLETAELSAVGLRELSAFIAHTVGTEEFRNLVSAARAVMCGLDAVRYSLHVRGLKATVFKHTGGTDVSDLVVKTFARFEEGDVRDYHLQLARHAGLDPVEALVLDGVAAMWPDAFRALDEFCTAHTAFVDPDVARFDREVHFYVAYLAYIRVLRDAGLSVAYPKVSTTVKRIDCRGAFDLALTNALVTAHRPVVTNDIELAGQERIAVVTGPNQGGKTTFARTVGQIHYLAALGCAVPGTYAEVFLVDRIFTHFERSDDPTSNNGRLYNDLERLRDILREMTGDSLLIANELFSSTALSDAVALSRTVMNSVSGLDALGVWVTFLTELASLNDKTASFVAAVNADDPAVRTFVIERRPANGVAYAETLAEKHGVTYRCLVERLRR
jgi:hypothetical protein